MEVIKNNYNSNELIEITCEHCNSILRCTEEEMYHSNCPVCGWSLRPMVSYCCDHCNYHFSTTSLPKIGEYGQYYVECPMCKKRVYLDREGIDITIDNLELDYFSSSTKGKHIEFSQIKGWIDRGLKYLKDNPSEYFHYSVSGDSFVVILKDDDEFYVIYSDNFKELHMK